MDPFRHAFQKREFLVYSRLKTRDPTHPSTLLFEIKARPELSYIIAMARPYPGRNKAMYVCPCYIGAAWYLLQSRLNTFLELKIENERLQNRLRELTGSAPGTVMNASPVISNRYPPSSSGPLPLYTSTSLNVGGYEDAVRSPVRSSFDGGSLYATSTLVDHQEDEEGGKKKKVHTLLQV